MKLSNLVTNWSGSVFVETVYPLVTTLKHYNGLFWYFENYGMLAGFLVYGKMTLVKRVIVEIKGNYCGKYIPICHVEEAIIVSINENKHERAIGLCKPYTTGGKTPMARAMKQINLMCLEGL